jgi:hypothetical protein
MPRTPLTTDEIRAIEALGRASERGTLYDVLDLPAGADSAAVDAAYRSFARTWHPDRFYTRDTGAHAETLDLAFATATRAFQTLSDATRRSAYDRELAAQGKRPGAERRNAESVGSWRGAGARPQREVPLPPGPGATSLPGALRGAGSPPPRSAPSTAPPMGARGPGGSTSPPATPPRAPAAVDRVRVALAEQLAKARTYFEAGKEDYDTGNVVRAESTLYLATKFDPKNEEYARLHQAARQKAGHVRARAYVEQAESEESYGRAKEALALYKRAVDVDPPEATAFFRAGRLLLSVENDERGAVAMYRKATLKEPTNAQYRVALAELYERNGLQANALREAQAALGAEPSNATAKALLKRLKG